MQISDMFLYNVTVGIDKDVELEWLQWIRQHHVPKVLSTGMFTHSKMFKVLYDDEEGSISYSVQFFADSLENVTTYFEKFAPPIMEELRTRFRDKHVAFMTLLEEV